MMLNKQKPSQKIFSYVLENIDAAAKDQDARTVATEFNKAISDFDEYINLIPDTEAS